MSETGAFFLNNPLPMLVCEQDSLHIIAVNKAAQNLYGYTEEEFLTHSIQDLRAKNNGNGILREANNGESVFTDFGIWLHQKKTGEQVYMQIFSYPVDYGNSANKLIIAQDVTKQTGNVNKVSNEQELFEVLTKNYPGIFYVFDENGKLERWNKRVEKVTGYTKSEVEQMPPLGFIAPSERVKVKEVIREAFESDGNEVETILYTKHGKKIPYYFKASKAYLQGKPYLVGIGVDISALENARFELQNLYEKEKEERARIESINNRLKLLNTVSNVFAKELKLKKALGKIADLLVKEVADIVSVYTIENDELLRFTHKAISKEVDLMITEINKKYPDFMNNLERFRMVMESGEAVFQTNFTEENLKKLDIEEGARKLLKVFGINSYFLLPLRVGNKIVGLLSLVIVNEERQFFMDDKGFLIEIADKIALHAQNIKVEEDLRYLNATLEEKVKTRTNQLEEANKELESFSYSVSHDLRAPLRAIAGYSNLLMEDHQQNMDDEGKEFLNIVHDETQRMGELIDELLAFSRMSRTQKNEVLISMNELVKESIQEIKFTYPDENPIFEIADLPEVVLDPKLMKQVWLNVLGNAIKYQIAGKRQIIKINSALDKNKKHYVFSVNDNGVGFDMKYADKIFGVFQRLHGDDEFEGTGIGLALAQRIIKRHGGKIWAESKLGEGSTFYFSLPVTK